MVGGIITKADVVKNVNSLISTVKLEVKDGNDTCTVHGNFPFDLDLVGKNVWWQMQTIYLEPNDTKYEKVGFSY